MQKLSFQDAAFLLLESPTHPFHVGGLMVFSAPRNAPRGYLRKLVARLHRLLPDADPVFRRVLDSAQALSPHWRQAAELDPAMHIHHYALPEGAGMAELMVLVSRAHERLLDRSRPLWEWHLIEGLPGDRFALYCKIHHALVDGIGAERLMQRLLAPRPGALRMTPGAAATEPVRARENDWPGDLVHQAEALLAQGRALPEIARMLLRMRREAAQADSPPMPFTAPRTLMNENITGRRHIAIADLPLAGLRRAGAAAGGTINDAFLAVCGGALRAYLKEQGALPRETLLGCVPVSVKDEEAQHGNALSTMLCPLATDTRDPLRRLRAIARVTRRAKADLRALSPTARQDYMNMILLPAIAFTVAHAATAVPPPFNVIASNVPGPRGALYLGGARLEAVYPLSVISDAQALNITGIGCGPRLCVAATTCPDTLPGIASLDRHLRQAWRDLQAAL